MDAITILLAYLGQAGDLSVPQIRQGSSDQIMNQGSDQVADRLQNEPFFIESGKLLLNKTEGLPPEFDFVKISGPDITCLETVINVVVVVGDLISQIDNLGFQSRSQARLITGRCLVSGSVVSG